MDGVREGFIQQELITKEAHEAYMEKNNNYERKPHCCCKG
jgi:hypothetical protein